MKTKSFIVTIAIVFFALSLVAQQSSILSDSRDAKTYKTITIGTQTWMAENLAYKTNSGCWAYENNISNVQKYGYLYDWKTAQSVCPPGWHLPIESEWLTLMKFLGSGDIAGGKLKSTIGWESPNTGATNSSGFSALPSGARFQDGSYNNATGYCYWWRTKEYNSNSAYFIQLSYDQVRVSENYSNKYGGASVRCIKNSPSNETQVDTTNATGQNISSSSSEKLRVKLGITPDFANSTEGLIINGVTKNGPAENGGMLKGDLIITLDGKKITDIYSYMEVLKKLDVGDTVIIEVMRLGRKEVLNIKL